MDITPRIDLTPEARFLPRPDHPLQRQYEAFRAYFVEGLPSLEVLTLWAMPWLRVLCHRSANWLTSRALLPGCHAWAALRPRPRCSPRIGRHPAQGNLSVYDPARAGPGRPHHQHQRPGRPPRRRLHAPAAAIDEERPPALRPEWPRPWPTSALSARAAFVSHGWSSSFFVPHRRRFGLAEVLAWLISPATSSDPATQGAANPVGSSSSAREPQEPCHGPGLRSGPGPLRRLNAVPSAAPTWPASSRDRRAPCPPRRHVVRRGAGRAATRRFHRPRFPRCRPIPRKSR